MGVTYTGNDSGAQWHSDGVTRAYPLVDFVGIDDDVTATQRTNASAASDVRDYLR